MNIFNFSQRKVGGIRFVKLGRFNASFSVARAYRPIGAKPELVSTMCSGPFWDELAAMAAECRTVDCGEARLDR